MDSAPAPNPRPHRETPGAGDPVPADLLPADLVPADPSVAPEPSVGADAPAATSAPATPTPEPGPATPYHRLARLRPAWCAWWRPLVAAFVALVVLTALASLLLVGTVLALAVGQGADAHIGQVLGDPTSPLDVFLVLAIGALAIPSVLLGVRLGGWRPTSLLWSVAGRIRWGLLGRAAGPVLGAFLLVVALSAVLDPVPRPTFPTGQLIAVMAIVVVLAPLRAVGLELAYRGLGQQAVGTWLRHPVWAILLPIPISLVSRTIPSTGALLTLVLLSAACGFLAWKTGGLELPILLQLGASGMSMLLAPLGAAAVPGAGPLLPTLLITLAILAVTAAVTWWFSRREGLAPLEPLVRPAGAPIPAPERF